MSLEAVVYQQLQSNSSYASTESRRTTIITTRKEDACSNPTVRRDQDTYLSTNLVNIVSPSSSSNTTIQNPSKPSNPASNAEDSTIISRSNARKREKRRRSNDQINGNYDYKSRKIEEERQRRKHIEVERNRRKQMNDYLSILSSLMPPSYSLRGDQASIVGGAINFVKKLEQLLQYTFLVHRILQFPTILDHRHRGRATRGGGRCGGGGGGTTRDSQSSIEEETEAASPNAD